jgi:hypothetical protein
LFEEVIRVPTGALKGIAKLRGRIVSMLAVTRQKEVSS